MVGSFCCGDMAGWPRTGNPAGKLTEEGGVLGCEEPAKYCVKLTPTMFEEAASFSSKRSLFKGKSSSEVSPKLGQLSGKHLRL